MDSSTTSPNDFDNIINGIDPQFQFKTQAASKDQQEIDKDLMDQFEQFQMQQIDLSKSPQKKPTNDHDKQENLSQESSSDSTNNTNNMNNIENIKNQINAEAHSPEPKKSTLSLGSPGSDNLFKSPCSKEQENLTIQEGNYENFSIREITDIASKENMNEDMEDLEFKPREDIQPQINSEQNRILQNLRQKPDNVESNGSKTDSDLDDSSGSNARDSADSNRDSSDHTEHHQKKRFKKLDTKPQGPQKRDLLEKPKSLMKALQKSSKRTKENSESSNTSGEDDNEISQSDPSDKDSSSGDSMDDGFEKVQNFQNSNQNLSFNNKSGAGKKQYQNPSLNKEEGFRLEGTMNESDLNQENSNSANENSAENNLENYEVDIENEDGEDMDGMPTYRDRMGHKRTIQGFEDMEDEDEIMLDEDDFENYRQQYMEQGLGPGRKNMQFQSGTAARRAAQQRNSGGQMYGFDERIDSDEVDDEDMLHQIEMDDSEGDEDMLMERDERDSDEMDEDEDLSAEYNNFFKLRMGKEKDQYSNIRRKLEASGMSFKGGFRPKYPNQKKAQKINILAEPKKDNLNTILESLKITNNQIRKIQIQTELKDKNYKYLNDLGAVFDMLDERYVEERNLPNNDSSIRSDASDQIPQDDQKPKSPKKDEVPIDQQPSLNDSRMQMISQIYKFNLLLGDQNIIEAMLSDRFYMQTFGALEYLQEVKGQLKCRQFFEDAIFKTVGQIKNPLILKKIHHNYRAVYLKETIFAKDEQQAPQSMNIMIMHYSIDILNFIMNDQEYLANIFQTATCPAKSLDENANAIQLVYDIVYQIKQYQQYLTLNYQRMPHIPSIIICQIKIFKIITYIFSKDHRVEALVKNINIEDMCNVQQVQQQQCQKKGDYLNNLVGLSSDAISPPTNLQEVLAKEAEDCQSQFSPIPSNSETFNNANAQPEPAIEQKFDLDKFHPRFTDKKLYDFVVTQLLDIINLLIQIYPKEFVEQFFQEVSMSQHMSQHLFFSENDAVAQQIIEIYKITIDQSGGNLKLQSNLESLMTQSLLPIFKGILSNENAKIQKSNFKDQLWMMFEFLQQLCKPMINSLIQEPRQGITPVMHQYIKENQLCQLALLEIKDLSNSDIHRLMAIKFLKSLFTLNDKDIIEEIKDFDLLGCVATIIDALKGKQRNCNMLQSSTLDLINMFSEQVKGIYGIDQHKAVIKNYTNRFSHCKNLLTQMYGFHKRTRQANGMAKPQMPASINAISMNPIAMVKQAIVSQAQQARQVISVSTPKSLLKKRRSLSFVELARREFDSDVEFKKHAVISAPKTMSETGNKKLTDMFKNSQTGDALSENYSDKRRIEIQEKNKQSQAYKGFNFKGKEERQKSRSPSPKSVDAFWSDSDDDLLSPKKEEKGSQSISKFFKTVPKPSSPQSNGGSLINSFMVELKNQQNQMSGQQKKIQCLYSSPSEKEPPSRPTQQPQMFRIGGQSAHIDLKDRIIQASNLLKKADVQRQDVKAPLSSTDLESHLMDSPEDQKGIAVAAKQCSEGIQLAMTDNEEFNQFLLEQSLLKKASIQQ